MNIYLAGNDRSHSGEVLHALKYPFRLASYYYLKEAPAARAWVLPFMTDGSDWIMDSGLFTLMFGGEAGTLTTFGQFREYALHYVEDMHTWGWKHRIVECDVQRVLGVEETMRLREDIFDKSGFEVIYVWHIPEGENGLRKLAKERAYIALSVPELRQVFGTGPSGGLRVRKALIHLLKLCRESGPATVHLLGCTEPALMKLPADSCDSTSWEAGRFGEGHVFSNGNLTPASIYSPKWQAWMDWILSQPRWRDGFIDLAEWIRQEYDPAKAPKGTNVDNRIRYYTVTGASACSFWLMMEWLNGQVQQS